MWFTKQIHTENFIVQSTKRTKSDTRISHDDIYRSRHVTVSVNDHCMDQAHFSSVTAVMTQLDNYMKRNRTDSRSTTLMPRFGQLGMELLVTGMVHCPHFIVFMLILLIHSDMMLHKGKSQKVVLF